ncbi:MULTISPECIES: hypothetical protein [Streptomyces]|uniref:hypothetical protein n=1 Tax=Streptomyces TaxID=1883 RepID=UPI0027D8159C|nr:hypothetical protein [Streptomyces demainii]
MTVSDIIRHTGPDLGPRPAADWTTDRPPTGVRPERGRTRPESCGDIAVRPTDRPRGGGPVGGDGPDRGG